MRFETKFDWGNKIAIVFAAILFPVALVSVYLRHSHHRDSFPDYCFIFVTLGIVGRVFLLPWSLPQYYEVRDDGLFIRQGVNKTLIPYASLVTIHPAQTARPLRVFSMDRLLIATKNGERFVIAVAEPERFLAEVAKHCPEMKLRHSRLEVPFTLLLTA